MRKKRENGMAKESGMGDFPRKQFESVLLHSLRIMDQNREYLQMHLARTGDERTRQALEDMGQESIRLERTLREMMGLLEVEMNDKPSMKPVDLCWILMEAAQIAPEIEKQLGIRLTVDHSPFRRCYVKADAQEAEQLLFHLLSNALRAVSPGGQIKIRLTRDDEDLYLIVEDDGCGLPTGENWMENRRRFLGGVQAGLLLCRRYCATWGGCFPSRRAMPEAAPGRRCASRWPERCFPLRAAWNCTPSIRHSPLPTACAGRSCGSLPCCPIKWNDMIFSALLRAFPGQGVFV